MTSRAGVLRCAIVGFCVAAKIAAVEIGSLGASVLAPAPAAPPPQPLPEVDDAMPCLNLITQDSCCDQWIGDEITEVCCPDIPRPDGAEWCCPWAVHDSIWRAARPYTHGWAPGTDFPLDERVACRWWIPICGLAPGVCEYDDFPSGESLCDSVRIPIDGAPCDGAVDGTSSAAEDATDA